MSGPKFTDVGKMPMHTGTFWVVDLMTNEQFWANILHREGQGLQVYSGKDHEVHPGTDFDRPNLRWFQVEPLSRAEIERTLTATV